MTIRSKHNDLLNYFLYDDKDLSKAYVRKCKNFIDNIHAEIHTEHLKELKNNTRENIKKFNEEQLELIKDILDNQESIWLEEEEEHYKTDLKLLKECKKIINRWA